jgi:adenylyltransferase/sulfurtransferase
LNGVLGTLPGIIRHDDGAGDVEVIMDLPTLENELVLFNYTGWV